MFLSLFLFKKYTEKEAADFQKAWFSLRGLDEFKIILKWLKRTSMIKSFVQNS